MITNLEARQTSHDVRTLQEETTESTARAIESSLQKLNGEGVVVTSAADVSRLLSADTTDIQTIFVIDGPNRTTDKGQQALKAIRENPNLLYKNVVLVSLFDLTEQLTQLYRDLGATEVITSSDFDPGKLSQYFKRDKATAA